MVKGQRAKSARARVRKAAETIAKRIAEQKEEEEQEEEGKETLEDEQAESDSEEPDVRIADEDFIPLEKSKTSTEEESSENIPGKTDTEEDVSNDNEANSTASGVDGEASGMEDGEIEEPADENAEDDSDDKNDSSNKEGSGGDGGDDSDSPSDSNSDTSGSSDDSDDDDDQGSVQSVEEPKARKKSVKRKINVKDISNKKKTDRNKKSRTLKKQMRMLDKSPKTFADLSALIELVETAIKFEGFDPKVTRNIFRDKALTRLEAQKKMYFCFTVYANIGNKIGNLNDKRNGQQMADRIRKIIEGWGIKPKRHSRTTVTLPRIVIAFLPEYYIFRRFILKDAQTQTSSQIEACYQDIAFSGCPSIYNMPGYPDYHKEFSSLIYIHEKGVDLEDKKFVRDYNAWLKVSREGFQRDKRTKDLMPTVLNETGLTEEAAMDYFAKAMEDDK